MWVYLNDADVKVWGDVFPDGKVPVCSMSFQTADLEGLSKTERGILVNWNVLLKAQKKAILVKLLRNFRNRGVCGDVSEEGILKDILRIGLPLRERYTTGVVAAELRFFI